MNAAPPWFHFGEQLSQVASSGNELYDLALRYHLGTIGVTLFFMVSGFVIPASLRPGGPRIEQLRAFAIRRFFRLYPIYLVSIPIGIGSIWWLWGREVDLPMLLANLTMAADQLGSTTIITAYWTLFTELAFYALCAALFACGLVHRPMALALASAAFMAIFLIGYVPGARGGAGALFFLYHTELTLNLSLMFAGALLRQWYDGNLAAGTPRTILTAILTVCLVLPLWAGAFHDAAGNFVWVYPGVEASHAIAVGLFLVLCFWGKPALGWLAVLGRASYSLYLLHTPIAVVMLWLALTQPAFGWLRGPLPFGMAAGFAISIAVAFLTYRFIELPMIDLGRRLSRPRAGLQASPQARLHA